jgi:hypothetical protein
MEAIMKSTLLFSAVFALLAGAAPQAFAHDGLGVGIVTGDTHGITLKIPTVGDSAVDVAAGVDLFVDQARLRADWLQPIVILGNGDLVVPLYIGLGGFVEPTDLGIRAPIGAAFQIQRTPIEIFAQTSLEATVVDQNNNSPDLGINGALGIRFYGR